MTLEEFMEHLRTVDQHDYIEVEEHKRVIDFLLRRFAIMDAPETPDPATWLKGVDGK